MCVNTKGRSLRQSVILINTELYFQEVHFKRQRFHLNPKVYVSLALARISIWRNITYTHRLQHVHFALRPFYSTPCMAAFTDSNLECWACLFSEIVIAVISHSVPWRFFKHCGLYFNYQYSGGAVFCSLSAVVSLCRDNPLPSQQQ